MNWFKRLFGSSPLRYPSFSERWRQILKDKVAYYSTLDSAEKQRFEESVLKFLNTTKITGIQTEIDDEDIVLIGASAIIPIFAFPSWEYHNLEEVLLYPAHFDFAHNIASRDIAILGMVGYGYMDGKMVLSKKALRLGFSNSTDKQNTAIHEFVHLIDKMDGAVDGIMVYLKEKEYVLPWLHLIDEKIAEIQTSRNDFRAYGATNRAEFLAVASEYFFERPKMFKRNHPKLYAYMELIFGQQLADKDLRLKSKPTRHFDPCPCGSGKKFRECCMR